MLRSKDLRRECSTMHADPCRLECGTKDPGITCSCLLPVKTFPRRGCRGRYRRRRLRRRGRGFAFGRSHQRATPLFFSAPCSQFFWIASRSEAQARRLFTRTAALITRHPGILSWKRETTDTRKFLPPHPFDPTPPRP